jgi:hypothetical protein
MLRTAGVATKFSEAATRTPPIDGMRRCDPIAIKSLIAAHGSAVVDVAGRRQSYDQHFVRLSWYASVATLSAQFLQS